MAEISVIYGQGIDPSIYLAGSGNVDRPAQVSGESDVKKQNPSRLRAQVPDSADRSRQLIDRMISASPKRTEFDADRWRNHLNILGRKLKNLKEQIHDVHPLQRRAFEGLVNKAIELPEYVTNKDDDKNAIREVISEFIRQARILRIEILQVDPNKIFIASESIKEIINIANGISSELDDVHITWVEPPPWVAELDGDESSDLGDFVNAVDVFLETIDQQKKEGTLPKINEDLINKLRKVNNELKGGSTQRLNVVVEIVERLSLSINGIKESNNAILTLKDDFSEIETCDLFGILKRQEGVGSDPNPKSSAETWKEQRIVLRDRLSILKAGIQETLAPTTNTIDRIVYGKDEGRISHEQYINIRVRLSKLVKTARRLPKKITNKSDLDSAKRVLNRLLNEIKEFQASNDIGPSNKSKMGLSSVRVLLQDVKRQARRMRLNIPE